MSGNKSNKEVKHPLTEKEYRRLMAVELGGFALMFAPFAVEAFLPGDSSSVMVISAFFFFALIEIVLVVVNFNRIMEYEWRTIEQKILAGGFAVLEQVKRSEVEAACLREKLKTVNGGYFRKKIFVGKHCEFRPVYVKCVKCDSVADDAEKEIFRFEEQIEPKGPVCLVLFLFCPRASDRDFERLMEVSKTMIVCEAMAVSYPGVVVLVEEETGKAYYVPELKRGAGFHAKGVGLMKKLAVGSEESA